MVPAPKKHKSVLSAYITWLESVGVKFNGITLEHGDVRGYGIYQTADQLTTGQVVCRIPRAAAMTYDYPGEDVPVVDISYDDCQLPLVLRILSEAKSNESVLQPKLDVLTGPDAGCAFEWPIELVRGTELELVCAKKRERMKEEVAKIDGITYEEYATLCGQVASHATPFFSKEGCALHLSLTSVVDMGNLKSARAEDADLEVVEAENDEVHIVARNTKSKLGDELYIAYGDPCINLSDTLYRYGFAPDDADIHAAVSLPSSLFPEGCIPTLKTLGLIGPSPWDGLEETWTIPLLGSDAVDRTHAQDTLSEGIALLMLASYVACNDQERHILPREDPDIILSPYESCALILLHAHREAIVTAEELMHGVAALKRHVMEDDESIDSESESDGDIWNFILHFMHVSEDSLVMSQATKAMMLSILSARLAALDSRKSSSHSHREKYAGYLERSERRTLSVAQEIVESFAQNLPSSLRESKHA